MRLTKVSLSSVILPIYIICSVVCDDGNVVMKLARVLLMGAFLAVALKRRRVRLNSYLICEFLFILFCAISCFWANNRSFAFDMTKTLIVNMLCMYAIIYITNNNQKRIDTLLMSCAVAPLLLELRVIATGGMFAFLTSRSFNTISANGVGLCAAFGACMSFYFLYNRKHNTWWALLFALNVIIVILSSSRKALMCVFIPFAIIYLMNNKVNLHKRILRIVLIVFIAFIGYYLLIKIPVLYDSIGNRIESMISMLLGDSSHADGSAITRFYLIQWGMEWFKQSPIIGHGIDNYRILLTSAHPDYPIGFYAHNNYVELLVDVGIIGTLLYYVNYILIIKSIYRNRRFITTSEYMLLGMLIALLINEYGLVSYYDKYVQVLLVIIWIVSHNINSRAENKSFHTV